MRGTLPPAVTPEMFREVFEQHPAGVLILEHLINRFTRPAVTDGGIDAVLKTYLRQGQRQPLDYILAQINRANGVNTEGETNESEVS
jgi:hypothetical protein